MTRADLPAVESIQRAHARAAEERPAPRRRRAELLAFRQRLASMLRAGAGSVMLVACEPPGGARQRGRRRDPRSAKVVGYLAGEVHVWEFGSEPAGWIVAVGIDPARAGRGVGARLRRAAVERFAALGVDTVRTMVRHDDVNVLRFFRDGGFRAGRYVELELSLE